MQNLQLHKESSLTWAFAAALSPAAAALIPIHSHMLAEVRVKKPFSTEKEGSKCESLLAMLRMSACGASSPWSSYQTLSWNWRKDNKGFYVLHWAKYLLTGEPN